MPKSRQNSKSTSNKPYSKTNTPSSQSDSKSNSNDTKSSSSALDEIETLFATKKLQAKQTQQQIQQQQELDRIERQRRKEARADEEADEWRLRGVSSSATASTAGASRKGEAVAPASYHAQAVQLKLTYTRSDLVQLNNSSSTNNNNNNSNSKSSKNHNEKWASDGLGGIFNTEGYTGRKDEGGHRVFKAHLMNREGFGMSPDCPFDCDCCYI